LTLEEKHRIQIGKVIFEKEKCIVYAKNRDCGACAEVCPTTRCIRKPKTMCVTPYSNLNRARVVALAKMSVRASQGDLGARTSGPSKSRAAFYAGAGGLPVKAKIGRGVSVLGERDVR